MSARARLFAGTCSRADTQVGPYKTSINPQKPGGDRAPPLQSTNAQCRFEIYQALIALVFRKAAECPE